jgi:hypothetical protein
LLQAQREKIGAETGAFNEQHENLLLEYTGQYVAMHQGKVVDHDPDLRTLHLRVFERFGHITVLLKQVSERPEREFVFRSPRLERVG